jgi:hypothetical protein
VSPRKQIYKITYPNGKKSDLTGAISYFGSPTAKARIEALEAEATGNRAT